MYNNLPRLRLVLRTAWITGLISSTFSTLVVVFGSHRIGRGIALSFMEVGTVLLRDRAVTREPEWYEVAAGIVVHQSADIFWAVVFWGLLAKFTWGLRPWALGALAIPWAIATVSIEYYLFLPVNQPLLTMQTPFWAAAGVHISSAAAYPAFYWIRNLVTGISEHVQFARRVAIVLVGALAVIAGVEIICEQGREPYLPLMAGQGWIRSGVYAEHGSPSRSGPRNGSDGSRQKQDRASEYPRPNDVGGATGGDRRIAPLVEELVRWSYVELA